MKHKKITTKSFSLEELKTIKISLMASKGLWEERHFHMLNNENSNINLIALCSRKVDEIDGILAKVNTQIDFLIVEECKECT